MTDPTALTTRRTEDELRAIVAAANPVPRPMPYPTHTADAMLAAVITADPSGTTTDVGERAAGRGASAPCRVPVLRRRPVRRLGVAALGAAAVTVAAIVVPGMWTTPAYAVGEGPQGIIHVEVNRLEQAAGLERALNEYGINADVQYLGYATTCQPDRFDSAKSAPDSSTRFTVGQGIAIDIDRRDVAHGETVVIAASRIRDGVQAQVGVAEGAVQGCRPVPYEYTPAD